MLLAPAAVPTSSCATAPTTALAAGGIAIDAPTLDAVLWGGLPLADALRSGNLAIEGDEAAVRRFVRLFPMPR
jgi:hypothetical protein